MKMYVPVLALFRLLGVETRAEAVETIVGDSTAVESRLLCSILDNDSTAEMDLEALYEYIGREAHARGDAAKSASGTWTTSSTAKCCRTMGLVRTPEVLRAKAPTSGSWCASSCESTRDVAVRRS